MVASGRDASTHGVLVFLCSDLRAIEDALAKGLDIDDPMLWPHVDRLARAWRQPWIRTAVPVELPEHPAELALVTLGARQALLVATEGGLVAIGPLDWDGADPGIDLPTDASDYHPMADFDPNTDEIRNVIVAPRRLSTEHDVFVTVRRWKPGAAPPELLLWRAVCWWADDEGPQLRPVVEQVPQGLHPWTPLPRAPEGKEALRQWFYDLRVQACVEDPLDPMVLDHVSALLEDVADGTAVSMTREVVAWGTLDGRLEVHRAGADPKTQTLVHPASALALVQHPEGGVELVLGTNDARIAGPVAVGDEPGELRYQTLDSAPRVIAAARAGDKLDILIAGEDHSLARWRFVGQVRPRAAWDGLVDGLVEKLDGHQEWEAWAAGGVHQAPEQETCQLLWLHAAWRNPDLLEGFLGNLKAGMPRPRGNRVGQELALLVSEDDRPELRARAIQMYQAGGLALREQVDRARLTGTDDELAWRATRNYWENAAGDDATERASAIGNLATRGFVHEATWHTPGRLVGVISRAGAQTTVIAHAQGIDYLAVPGDAVSKATRQSERPFQQIAGGPASDQGALQWRWARSLHDGAERFGILFGGERGLCALVLPGPSGPMVEDLSGDQQQRCVKAMNLEPLGDDGLTIGVLWTEGPRALMDTVSVTRESGGLSVSPVQRLPVPAPATCADFARVGNQRVLAVATPTRKLELLRLDGGLSRLRSVELDSPAFTLRFDQGLQESGRAPVLLVGTQGGMVWCLDVQRGTARWVYDAGRAITCVDVQGTGKDLSVAVAAAPDHLAMLDAEGRRRWRHRIAGRPLDLSLLPGPGGVPGRIVVVDDGGRLSLYRRTRQDHWLKQAAVLDGNQVHTERLRMARAIGSGDFIQTAGELSGERSKRALLAAAAGDPRCPETDLADLVQLHASGPDLAAMARELATDMPLSRWELLWDRAVLLLEDGDTVGAEAGELLAETLAHLARRDTSFKYVADRLAELREIDIEHLRSGALAVARAWSVALQRDEAARGDLPLVEVLLRHLHTLPAAATRYLHHFVAPPAAGVLAVELLRGAARQEPPSAALESVVGDLRSETSRTVKALGAALALVRAPTWENARAVLEAGAEVPAGKSPLVAALRLPAIQAPSGDLPEVTWRLDRQARWLTEALGRRMALPASSGEDAWAGVAGWLLGHVGAAYQEAVLARLTAVVAQVRVRLSTKVLRWVGDTVTLGLDLVHEGPLAITEPTVQVGVPGGSGDTPLVDGAWEWTGKRLEPGDPPIRGRLRLTVPEDPQDLKLLVTVKSKGETLDETLWPVDVGRRAQAPAGGNLLLDSDRVWSAFKERVARVDRGVAVLVLDAVLDPEVVVDRLMDLPGSDRVDLDQKLADLGPGRRRPDALTSQAVLRVLGGRDPLDESVDFGSGSLPREGDGPGRVVLHPANDTTQRLLGHKRVWEEMRQIMRAYAESSSAPAVIVVLPAALGAAKFAELVESGAKLLHPAHLETGMWEEESLLRTVARRLRTDTASAGRAVVEAGGDLRVLEDRLRHRGDTALAWARGDLAGLEPSELAALVALSAGRTRVLVSRVQRGMVSAETVKSTPKTPGRQAKVLARQGSPVDNPSRVANVRRELLVRGMADTDLKDLPEAERSVLHLVGFDAAMQLRLLRLGLLVEDQGLIRLRPDLDRLIGRMRSNGGLDLHEVIEALGDQDTWWRAIRIKDLVHVDQDGLGPYRPHDAERAAHMFRNLGRLWRDEDADLAVAANLVRAWTGAPPVRTSRLERSPAVVTAEIEDHDALPGRSVALHFLPSGATAPPTRSGRLDVYIGPGVDYVERDGAEVCIGDAQVRAILRSPDMRQGFWAAVRAQLDMTELSPFTHNAALPVGSPMFVGRSAIRRYAAANLRRRSMLILGARQVGKTSLLHQLYHEACQRQQDDKLDPMLIDAQGRDTPALLLSQLRQLLGDRQLSPHVADTEEALDRLELHALDGDRMPVLFVNEIDGLLRHSSDFLQRLRARHEAGRMRFVFVGYAAARWALDDGESPLFHFTQAAHGRAWFLGPLEPDESRELIGWLTRPPLALQWQDDDHRARGEALLMDHAHHIAWVLQDLCQALVEDMAGRGVGLICLDDMRRVLDGRPSLLDHLHEFGLADAMGQEGESADGAEESEAPENKAPENLAQETGRLILLLLATRLYFADGQRPSVAEIRAMSPQAVAFRTGDVLRMCEEGLDKLPVLDTERRAIQEVIAAVPMRRFLQALSLSLILAPIDTEDGEPGWWFHGHIYPAELRRAEAMGRSIEDRIHDQAQRVLYHLQPQSQGE